MGRSGSSRGRGRGSFDDREPTPDCLADGFEDDVEAVAFGSDLGSPEERHPSAHELSVVLEQLRRDDRTEAFDELGVPTQVCEEEPASRDGGPVASSCVGVGFVRIHCTIL